jgi:ABC-2 type transport system permease protein
MPLEFFSWHRLLALLRKEFIQLGRDKLTFSMIVIMPLMQLFLFGYALNTDPKGLPTAVHIQDHSSLSRHFLQTLETSDYFKITHTIYSESQGKALLSQNLVQFIVNIPANFERDLIRGRRPTILVEADASDPVATANALSTLGHINMHALDPELQGILQSLQAKDPPYTIQVHRQFNPEGITQYNIVPGLIGTILTLTLVILAAAAVTREKEHGTMENLLATPVRPLEVMLGKIIPFIIIGFLQVGIIIIAAKLLFDVPIVGSIILLCIVTFLFIIANLSVGFTFSTLSQTQLQANQMGTFFFLPSILLSGFFFPFRGMPGWAQVVGETLPLTHYLRIIRGILLKGNGMTEIWVDLWPIVVFMLVAMLIALRRYKDTLD